MRVNTLNINNIIQEKAKTSELCNEQHINDAKPIFLSVNHLAEAYSFGVFPKYFLKQDIKWDGLANPTS